MNIRRIRIWLSREWFNVVSGVTLLLLPLLCSSCKTTSAANRSQVNAKDTVSVKNDTVALTQLTADMIEKVRKYEGSDLYRQTAYGPPEVLEELEKRMNATKKERRRAARKAGK